MRKITRILLIPAAFAIIAGAGIATTAEPAKAQVSFGLNFGTPYYYAPYPYCYRPYGYYYAPRCYWDRYYGRVCY